MASYPERAPASVVTVLAGTGYTVGTSDGEFHFARDESTALTTDPSAFAATFSNPAPVWIEVVSESPEVAPRSANANP